MTEILRGLCSNELCPTIHHSEHITSNANVGVPTWWLMVGGGGGWWAVARWGW